MFAHLIDKLTRHEDLTDEDVERLIRQGVRNYLGYVKGYGGNG